MDLGEIRKEIDEIDKELAEGFQRRMELCRQVGEYKLEKGLKVLDRGREKEKLASLEAMADSEFNRFGLKEMFTQIMGTSRKLQYRLMAEKGADAGLPFETAASLPKKGARVVYQGVPGAYSHAASVQFF